MLKEQFSDAEELIAALQHKVLELDSMARLDQNYYATVSKTVMLSSNVTRARHSVK